MERTKLTGIDEEELLAIAFSSIEWCKDFKKEMAHYEMAHKESSVEDETTRKVVQSTPIKS